MSDQSGKPDFQTLSLFLTLAVLTGIFVLGLRWILLTPELPGNPGNAASVESASK